LKLEIDICHAEDLDMDLNSLTSLFDEEKKKFDEIMEK
jgi:hypothetical protein